MVSIKRIVADTPFLSPGCVLGEAPLYDPRTSILHFVDIEDKKIFHFDIQSLELSVDEVDDRPTCLALRRDAEGLACVGAQGFGVLDNGCIRYFCAPFPEDYRSRTRFNDGACDSKGRFFAGTMFSRDGIPGVLYRYDPADGSCVVVDKGPFTDSNGLGWSSDEKTMYFTDSLTNIIYAYDYDDGELSNRRVFVDGNSHELTKGSFPDGLCIDSEGGVWSARWGGSSVIRFTPDGDIDVVISIPTALNVTACCFGESNDDQLFITTAHCGAVGGDASRQALYPDSGHLFRVDLSDQFQGGTWRYEFAG